MKLYIIRTFSSSLKNPNERFFPKTPIKRFWKNLSYFMKNLSGFFEIIHISNLFKIFEKPQWRVFPKTQCCIFERTILTSWKPHQIVFQKPSLLWKKLFYLHVFETIHLSSLLKPFEPCSLFSKFPPKFWILKDSYTIICELRTHA